MREWLEDDLKEDKKKIVISEETKNWFNEAYARCEDNQKTSIRSLRWSVACISLVSIFSLLGLGIYNPVLTKAIPPIYTILEKIHNNLFDKSNYSPYIEKTLLSNTQEAITLSVEEVVYDYKEIGYRYTITSEDKPLREKSTNKQLFLDDWIMVNGEKVDVLSATGKGEFIDNYTYQGDTIITLQQELPDEINLTIGVKGIDTGDNEVIEGDWQVQTSLKQKTTPVQSVLIQPVTHMWQIGESTCEIKVNKIAYSSLYTYVELRLELDEEQEEQYNIDWTLIDSQGNTYIPKEMVSERREHEIVYTAKFTPIPVSNRPEWVKVIPSLTSKASELGTLRESTIDIQPGQFKQVLHREGFGDISIDSIKQQGNDILMIATVEPIQDMRLQATRIVLRNGKNGIQCNQLYQVNSNQMQFLFQGARLQDLESIIFYDSNQQWDLSQSILIPLQ